MERERSFGTDEEATTIWLGLPTYSLCVTSESITPTIIVVRPLLLKPPPQSPSHPYVSTSGLLSTGHPQQYIRERLVPTPHRSMRRIPAHLILSVWTGVLSRNIRPRPTELQCLVKLNVWAQLVRAGYSFEGDSGLEMRKRAHRIIMGLFSEQWLVEDVMLWVDVGCKSLPYRIYILRSFSFLVVIFRYLGAQ